MTKFEALEAVARFEALQGTGWTGDAWWQLYDHRSRICIGPRHDTREACDQFMFRMAQLSLMEERGL